MTLTLVLHAVLLATLLAGSHALLRYASGLDPSLLSWPRAGYTAVALAIYGVIFVYYAVLLERLPLSKLYPLYTGLSVALVYLAGVALFGEPWTWKTVLGVALLIVGVALVGQAASAQ